MISNIVRMEAEILQLTAPELCRTIEELVRMGLTKEQIQQHCLRASPLLAVLIESHIDVCQARRTKEPT